MVVKPIKFILPAICILLLTFASAGHATHWIDGLIYCDTNENQQFDYWDDQPMQGVVVNVYSPTTFFTTSNAEFGGTDIYGGYHIQIPPDPDTYLITLDPATLPPDYLFIIPPTGTFTCVSNDPVQVICTNDWLIDSSICHPTEEPGACRVTAGGNKDGEYCPLDSRGLPLNGSCVSSGPDTWGGQAGAPPRIDGNWTHHHKPSNKDNFVFHSNNLFSIQCSDPGDFCEPARFAPNRQIDFMGLGRFNSKNGTFSSFPSGDVCFAVHLEDTGEPGPGSRKNDVTGTCTHCPGTPIVNEFDCPNCTDYYMIQIYGNADCSGTPIYINGPGVPENCTDPTDPHLDGYFTDKGNVQMHPDNNGP